MTGTAARTYRSPKRAEQAATTRLRILAAATRKFTENGYTATSLRAVAAEAGVSVPAVELAFRSKPQLLKAAIDVAIAGDDEPVPVLHRDWVAQAQRDRSVHRFLGSAAGVLSRAQARSSGLILAAYEAAGGDAGIGGVIEQLEAGRTGTAEWIVAGVTDRVGLRPELTRPVAIDIVWLLMDPVVFRRLTVHRGWTDERYEIWFADSVVRLLAPAGAEVPPTEER